MILESFLVLEGFLAVGADELSLALVTLCTASVREDDLAMFALVGSLFGDSHRC